MTEMKAGLSDDGILSLLPYFMEQTRNRLEEIKVHRQAILDRQDAAISIRAICDLAHKISGTADTFGFVYLGVLALRVEDVHLDTAFGLDDPAVLCFEMENAITPLIQEMTKVLEAK